MFNSLKHSTINVPVNNNKTGGCCGSNKTNQCSNTAPKECSDDVVKDNSNNKKTGGCCGAKKTQQCNNNSSKQSSDDVESKHQSVQDYYGKQLSKSSDLKTNACCTGEAMPDRLKAAASLIHDEVMIKYYGCGLVVPELLEGCNVLDLGCGAGRDCYLISYMVGANGQVVGVDMTDEQLAVAQAHREYHASQFGFPAPNTDFKKGYIEKLDELDLEPGSFDVIVSNCVINLSPDKDAVLKGAYNLLKEGGEMYFSDVYSDRRVPKELVEDPVLYGECLSGALYWNDFLRIARRAGFSDPRLVTSAPITIKNKKIEEKVGHIKFRSATYRLFKIPELEEGDEDYGEAVIYKGTVPTSPNTLILDGDHAIDTGRVYPVGRNTVKMLTGSRFAPHFEVVGEGTQHFGLFKCGGNRTPFENIGEASVSGGGCC